MKHGQHRTFNKYLHQTVVVVEEDLHQQQKEEEAEQQLLRLHSLPNRLSCALQATH
jgi:ferredoxin